VPLRLYCRHPHAETNGVTSTSGIEARDAMELKESWTDDYLVKRHGEILADLPKRGSKRNGGQSSLRAITENDWDNLYRRAVSKKASNIPPASESFADSKPAVGALPTTADDNPKRAMASASRSGNH